MKKVWIPFAVAALLAGSVPIPASAAETTAYATAETVQRYKRR